MQLKIVVGIWPIPCYLYFYTGGHYTDWVPYSWCFVYYCLTDYLPTISHTASIWLTVGLAVQRYMLVCHSLDARRWSSISNMFRASLAVYFVAILFHVSVYSSFSMHSFLVESEH